MGHEAAPSEGVGDQRTDGAAGVRSEMEEYSVVGRAVQALDEQRRVCVDGQLMCSCAVRSRASVTSLQGRINRSARAWASRSGLLRAVSGCDVRRFVHRGGERTGHGWCPFVNKPGAHILILGTTNPAQMAASMTSQSDGQPRTTARCATPGHPGGSDVRRSSALCTGDALGR